VRHLQVLYSVLHLQDKYRVRLNNTVRQKSMPRIKTILLSLLLQSPLLAGESQMQLLSQPILANGGSESWGSPDIEFKVVDVPYIDWHHQGHPAFEGIAQTNQVLTNAPRSIPPIESNLIAFYGITIGRFDPNTKELWLRLDSAKAVGGWQTTVDQAAFAAIECIRVVSERYKVRPILRISAPRADIDKWKGVADKFNAHDLSVPFTPEDKPPQK